MNKEKRTPYLATESPSKPADQGPSWLGPAKRVLLICCGILILIVLVVDVRAIRRTFAESRLGAQVLAAVDNTSSLQQRREAQELLLIERRLHKKDAAEDIARDVDMLIDARIAEKFFGDGTQPYWGVATLKSSEGRDWLQLLAQVADHRNKHGWRDDENQRMRGFLEAALRQYRTGQPEPSLQTTSGMTVTK